jgi:trans-aconitate methyltransferase
MRVLYGRHYASRYEEIAALIPEGASVLELCCGPAQLYRQYLRSKRVDYTGLDVNGCFIKQLQNENVDGRVWDLRENNQLPSADYVLMQASLYHFLPDTRPIIDRMLEAARRQVIIAEPIRNLSSSSFAVVRSIARYLTKVGGENHERFTEQMLDQFFSSYQAQIERCFLIPGGREKVYVLSPQRSTRSTK